MRDNAEQERIRRLVAAGNFVANNGRVLRAINILRYDYKKLREIEFALPDIERDEIVDSVNYLAECGYVTLRHMITKRPATLADDPFGEIEAKLAKDGIRLLAGRLTDDCVEV